MIGFGGHGKEKKRRRKERIGLSKACHFCHRKVIGRMTESISKSG